VEIAAEAPEDTEFVQCLPDVEMTAGEFASALTVNGKIAVSGLALREQAIRGLLGRLESLVLSYVFGMRTWIADCFVEICKVGIDTEKGAALHAANNVDKATIARTLVHECRHSFWWSIWLNHRVSWIRRYNADKRAAAELPFTHDELMAMSPVVYPGQLLAPPDIEDDEIAHCAWSLLALGYLPTEVRDALHLNNHKYYAMIDSWKTATVHDWLTGQYH
jgi:hypothetical protein